MNQALLRQIPKMDLLLDHPLLADLCQRTSRAAVKAAIQETLQQLRRDIADGSVRSVPDPEQLCRQILSGADTGCHLRRVINATGVVLHTNLGRAPLSPEAADNLSRIARGYCNLEYDLDRGCRGSRYDHVEELICRLTGAEAAMVVNNNAGAVFLMLNTLARGKNVAISRGELVEIGGSFRVPEIMEQSGARLVEVGTTNKTHPRDYEAAMEEKGATVLLKVHTSNFAIIGFTESVPVDTLSRIARAHEGLTLYDLGSCFQFPCEYLGLHEGESAAQALSAGADVVCFSGDKLMGSAQAGILAGRKALIDQIRRNHLTRMLRIDKLSLAALEIALRDSLDPQTAIRKIPTLRMLAMTREDCRTQAQDLCRQLCGLGFAAEVIDTDDEVGGGSLPGLRLPSAAAAVSCDFLTASALEKVLRSQEMPIISHIQKDRVLLSPRTFCEGDLQQIVSVFAALSQKEADSR